MPAERITVIGRPIRQAFFNAPEKHVARRRLGLADVFTCLVSFGREGMGGNPRDMVSALLDSGIPLQVVAITGRNELSRKELQVFQPPGKRLRVEGFVENMAEYLAACDVFVGKAGPSSVYEALAVGRPVVATGYAGLNELGVARYIEREGLGSYAKSDKDLVREVRRYAANPARLGQVARRCVDLDLASRTERFAHHIVNYAETGGRSARLRLRKTRTMIMVLLSLGLGLAGFYVVVGGVVFRPETYRLQNPSVTLLMLTIIAFLAKWMSPAARIWLLCRAQKMPLLYRSAMIVQLGAMFVAAFTPNNTGVAPATVIALGHFGVPLGGGIGVAVQLFFLDLIFSRSRCRLAWPI